jgi:hypothetical protein
VTDKIRQERVYNVRVEGKHCSTYAADADLAIAIVANVTVALDRTSEATQPDGFMRYALLSRSFDTHKERSC